MNPFSNQLSMDLMQPQKPPVIHAVQGESNTRSVELALFHNGEAWNIPDGVSLSVRYKKPDLKGGIYDTLPDGASALSCKDNTVTAILAPQMLTVPGAVLAQIELRKADAVLSTFTFHVVVESNPAAGALPSETYVNMLHWLEEEFDAYIREIRSNGEMLGGTAPRNLLDNSDFKKPVNQRGETVYKGVTQSIDRWRAYHSDTIHEVTPDGIKVSATSVNKNIYQILDTACIDVTKKMTAACCDDAGNIMVWCGVPNTASTGVCVYRNSADGRYLFRIGPAKTEKVYVWAALYYGEYTAETLPAYQPKGYGAELAACQRYYQLRSTDNVPGVDLRPTMRLENPTVTAVSGGFAYSADL